MFDTTKALYADLARALGVAKIPADERGVVQLTIGEDASVVLAPEDAGTLTLLSPVGKLPLQIDTATVLWLLRRNFHDSPTAPFRIGADAAGTVVLWGHIPTQQMTGERLAGLIDSVAQEVALIRDEIAVDETEEG